MFPRRPVDAASATLIAVVRATQSPSRFRHRSTAFRMFSWAARRQQRAVTFDYTDESDPGPYPIPAGRYDRRGREQRRRPACAGGGHPPLEVVRTVRCASNERRRRMACRFWGSVRSQQQSTTSIWTRLSADAAGLPIFPGLVRYDEVVERGVIDHALKIYLPAHAEGIHGDTCKAGVAGALGGEMNVPQGLAINGSGKLHVADNFNNRIQRFGDLPVPPGGGGGPAGAPGGGTPPAAAPATTCKKKKKKKGKRASAAAKCKKKKKKKKK